MNQTLPPAAGPQPAALSYSSIDEVPDSALRDVLLRSLRTYGATEVSELIQTAARQLGFKRTGKHIQARIEKFIERLDREGQICHTADRRFQLAQTGRAASV
jgi:hypothetical protein